MTASLSSLLLLGVLLTTLQVLCAVPWLIVFDPSLIKTRLRNPKTLGYTLLSILGVGVVFGLLCEFNSEPKTLEGWGRIYCALLELQLFADFFVGVFFFLLLVWPKGGAVALAAFREGVRQPMFWVLGFAGFGLIGISPVLPYFTFGEDIKMLKDLGYITIMAVAALFAVLTASTAIAEEIEGRTAVTVMSKPISRRNFLIGKFLGILIAGLSMSVMLGWWLVWIILLKEWFDPQIGNETKPDPLWVLNTASSLYSSGPAYALTKGILLWVHEFGSVAPGLLISFCQVMVLLSIAVALATRLPMIVNAMICLSVYFLGHLTPVLNSIALRAQDNTGQARLIYFVAQVFDYVLPNLDRFDMGPAVVRYAPLPAGLFSLYTLNVTVYALTYTTIALVFGLILFEDRDVA
ncbi:MAG: ABC transporter permease subunit [Gemmataceae bacterium]